MLDKRDINFDFDGVICDSVNIKTQALLSYIKIMVVKYNINAREYHLINSLNLLDLINLNGSNQFCLNKNL